MQTIAQHIAQFTGPKTKFLERKFRKHLERNRSKGFRKPHTNKIPDVVRGREIAID